MFKGAHPDPPHNTKVLLMILLLSGFFFQLWAHREGPVPSAPLSSPRLLWPKLGSPWRPSTSRRRPRPSRPAVWRKGSWRSQSKLPSPQKSKLKQRLRYVLHLITITCPCDVTSNSHYTVGDTQSKIIGTSFSEKGQQLENQIKKMADQGLIFHTWRSEVSHV